MERERPHHLLVTMLLLGVLAGVAGPAGASYPSSEPGVPSPLEQQPWDAAPSPRPSAPPPPCDSMRLADRICDDCLPNYGVAPPSARCCAALLAAGRARPDTDDDGTTECFCATLLTDAFQAIAIPTWDAIQMYYQCGGRHNVTVCFD